MYLASPPLHSTTRRPSTDQSVLFAGCAGHGHAGRLQESRDWKRSKQCANRGTDTEPGVIRQGGGVQETAQSIDQRRQPYPLNLRRRPGGLSNVSCRYMYISDCCLCRRIGILRERPCREASCDATDNLITLVGFLVRPQARVSARKSQHYIIISEIPRCAQYKEVWANVLHEHRGL